MKKNMQCKIQRNIYIVIIIYKKTRIYVNYSW